MFATGFGFFRKKLVSSGRMEEACFFQFLLEETGRNWKKPEETKILLGNDRKQLWNILKQLSLMVDET